MWDLGQQEDDSVGIQGHEEMAQWVKFKHEDLSSDPPVLTLKNKNKNNPVCNCKPSAGRQRQVDPESSLANWSSQACGFLVQ